MNKIQGTVSVGAPNSMARIRMAIDAEKTICAPCAVHAETLKFAFQSYNFISKGDLVCYCCEQTINDGNTALILYDPR